MLNHTIAGSPCVYGRLQDELSRDIYKYRTLYNFTGESFYIRKLVATAPHGKIFLEKLNRAVARKNGIGIFGAGTWGKEILKSYPNINFLGFIDNDRGLQGKVIENIQVFSLAAWLREFPDAAIIVSSKLYHAEIHAELAGKGVPEENIINAGQYIFQDNKNQYFDLPAFFPSNNEVFLDGGAFDGLSSEMFLNWAASSGRQASCSIRAFEADPANVEKLAECLKNAGVEHLLFSIGLWNKRERLYFQSGLNGASHLVRENVVSENIKKVEVDSIDNLLNEKITFLKMDIEGAELEALQGAENLIKSCKPRLAICVYHKPEDIYAIPELILSMVPEYCFWLRHYSVGISETVLYGYYY